MPDDFTLWNSEAYIPRGEGGRHKIYPDERSDDVYPTEGSEGVGA
jgi:hypothetical protein